MEESPCCTPFFKRKFFRIPDGSTADWLDLLRPSLKRISEACVDPRKPDVEELTSATKEFLSFPDLVESHVAGKSLRYDKRGRHKFLLICSRVKMRCSPPVDSRPGGSVVVPTSDDIPVDTRVKAAVSMIHNAVDRGNMFGVTRRACSLLTSTSTLPLVTSSLVDSLQLLHPSSDAPDISLPGDSPFLSSIDPVRISSIVRKKCSGASPGPSGFTAELLLPIIEAPSDPCFLGFCHLLLAIINGVTGPVLRHLLTSSSLIPLSKPSGGYRPIAMGEVVFKLAASYIISSLFPVISEFFLSSGVQFGVGVRGAHQSAILATQAALELIPNSILLKADIHNAFNSISRSALLSTLFAHKQFGALWRLVMWSYSQPSDLICRNNLGRSYIIPSESGVKQGDCLGPFLFALCINDLLVKSYNLITPGSSYVVSYLDDINIVAPPDVAFSIFSSLGVSFSKVHLHFNFSKCFILVKNDILYSQVYNKCISGNIPVNNIHFNSLEVLGSYVYHDADSVKNVIAKIFTDKLSFRKYLLNNFMPKQIAIYLLRSHLLPSIHHILRTLSPAVTYDCCINFDLNILNIFQKALSLPKFDFIDIHGPVQLFSPTLEASLTTCIPFNAGWLGIIRCQDLVRFAYFSACALLSKIP